jgi:adenosylhomocysteine nucleosidase
MRRVAVLAATTRELASVRSACRRVRRCGRRERLGGLWHEVGEAGQLELHLIKTGIGCARARDVGETALGSLRPDAVISTGYAGALNQSEIGELVLANEVVDWNGGTSRTRIAADADLLRIARSAAEECLIPCFEGTLLTVAKLVCRATDKRALRDTSGAAAIDMESAVLAKIAGERGIPFLAIRAISDKVGEDLPIDFNLWLVSWGSVRGMMQVMRHPSCVYGLRKLKLQADLASDNLRRFFNSFFTALEAHPQPLAAGRSGGQIIARAR